MTIARFQPTLPEKSELVEQQTGAILFHFMWTNGEATYVV